MVKRVGPRLLLVVIVTLAGLGPAAFARAHRHRRNHVSSGVRGIVLAGPVCPVERVPPDPNCADRPIVAHLTLSHGGGGGGGQASSGADGIFEIRAAPGRYTLSATTREAMRCDSQTVVVSTGAFTDVQVSCDTGIR
jgi:hypothetical protein